MGQSALLTMQQHKTLSYLVLARIVAAVISDGPPPPSYPAEPPQPYSYQYGVKDEYSEQTSEPASPATPRSSPGPTPWPFLTAEYKLSSTLRMITPDMWPMLPKVRQFTLK